jgi:peptide-methionine (R)-S-oxide reductase
MQNPNLSEEQKHILFNKGTERPFTHDQVKAGEDGRFYCINCNTALFDAGTKFESGCGWPSFSHALDGAVKYHEDNSYGMQRTEVTCACCGGHLGHVFNDGPIELGGMRYCINGSILK